MISAQLSRSAVSSVVAFLGSVACAAGEPPADLPSEYEQVIPRGRIASIDAPDFVAAGKARIPSDAWILGVVLDGQARAYSLNLLNSHEIVNDRIGEQAFAAVW